MLNPERIDLAADRWVPFLRSIPIIGIDLTGASFLMQVRRYGDEPASALVNLATVSTAAAEGVRLIYAGIATVAAHINAERLPGIPAGLSLDDNVLLSLIGIRINETTVEGLPFPEQLSGNSQRGDNSQLVWDIHITPSNGTKDRYAWGSFTVRAGATQ